MIRSITGNVIRTELSYIVIETGGIGYLIHTPNKNIQHLDKQLTLHTHMAVRENSLDLYGFTSYDDLQLFELLLTLPKIGPKSALQILSQADSTLIKSASASNDATQLSKLSGIGKKTAEKIVVGLKEYFEDYQTQNNIPQTDEQISTAYATDAIDALIALGYPQVDARNVIKQLTTEHPEITTANELVREALTHL